MPRTGARPHWLIAFIGFAVVAAMGFALLPQPVTGTIIAAAKSPTSFGLDLPSFRAAFDRTEAAKNPANPASGAIASCDHMPDDSDQCTTGDAGFLRSVSLMRAAGLMDHTAKQDVTILLQRDRDGRVASVEVDGTRADQANALRFSDVVTDVLSALQGQAGSDASVLKMRLGLMSGDNDATINEPKTIALPGTTVQCVRSRSNVSMLVRCIFHPG
ncbi:hypothetical protein [Beijerinckia sp. L45]|uniref:hypothetical protein n=1 Tax=Beijerinckia sp. L45 TaxID=1641855 RepID=UPI00131A9262|nr:hypothetical protein [Beijerinckia sp. L45]